MSDNKIRIAVSKLAPNYVNWLNKLHPGLEIVDLFDKEIHEVADRIVSFSGVLLSGGGDIHPGLYGRPDEMQYCEGVDSKRDELEIRLIELAFQHNIPLLGICRGQQILTVSQGGTLFPDISTFIGSTIIHKDKNDVNHTILIRQDSLLFNTMKKAEGIVNSAHHQAVDKIASGFRATVFSSDGIIEAIESLPTRNHRFCMAVQWHPERMEIDNPLSGMLGKMFIEEALQLTC
jgi:putative glutamine amidotransferase